MNKLLIFNSDTGSDCNSYYHIQDKGDLDLAALDYLQALGEFAWDTETEDLQRKVLNKDLTNLYITFTDMASEGYDCFRLESYNGWSLTSFDTFKDK